MTRLVAERPHVATVTVTHHLEELPASTTHALLLRAGAIVASGPDGLSTCFGPPIALERLGGRWSARARMPG